MHEYRTIEPVENMSEEYLDSGHFWVQEYVTGRILRFEMEPSGLLTFGGADSRFDPNNIPIQYRRAIKFVRRNLNRDRLRDGVDSVTGYTFFGLVALSGGTQYEWSEIPAFLGLDIWDEAAGGFTSEDITERVFEAIGLNTAPIIQKEVPARSFDPATYSIPDTRWGDEPAAGVLLRKKNGQPALLTETETSNNPWQLAESSEQTHESLDAWVESRVTGKVIDSLSEDLGIDSEQTSIETTASEIATELARRDFDTVGHIVESSPERFKTAVQERVRSLEGAV